MSYEIHELDIDLQDARRKLSDASVEPGNRIGKKEFQFHRAVIDAMQTTRMIARGEKPRNTFKIPNGRG